MDMGSKLGLQWQYGRNGKPGNHHTRVIGTFRGLLGNELHVPVWGGGGPRRAVRVRQEPV